MKKNTALERVEVICDLISRLPEDAYIHVCNAIFPEDRVVVHVNKYYDVLGDSYTDGKVWHCPSENSFSVSRFYTVGTAEIAGEELPIGYSVTVGVDVEVTEAK